MQSSFIYNPSKYAPLMIIIFKVIVSNNTNFKNEGDQCNHCVDFEQAFCPVGSFMNYNGMRKYFNPAR